MHDKRGIINSRKMKIHQQLLYFLAAAVITVGVTSAQETAPEEAPKEAPKAGRDYILMDVPQPMRVPAGKIEVLEFFNFSCPHCYRLQGPFSRWRDKADIADVVIIHQPVVFQKYSGHFARMFFTLESLGLIKEQYTNVFTAIHNDKKLLNSKSRFIDWLEETHGIDPEKAEDVYESFTVNIKTSKAETVADVYGITSTPQLVVAGKYITNLSLSRSYDKLFDTLEALLEQERKALATTQ